MIEGLIVVALVVIAVAAFLLTRRKGDDAQVQSSDPEKKNEASAPSAVAVENMPRAEAAEAKSETTNQGVALSAEAEEVKAEPAEEPYEAVDLSKRTRPDTNGLPYVLVAEDNMSNYKLIEVMLRGVAVTENAVNGRKTVDYTKVKDYDMILMDIKMPILNGLDATKEIRRFDTQIPIIAVTANVLDFDKNMALSCGCNEFVPKPIIRKDLLEVINTYKRK